MTTKMRFSSLLEQAQRWACPEPARTSAQEGSTYSSDEGQT
jgi:hypothetical protein